MDHNNLIGPHFATHPRFLDSNNFSIGIHSFKVLVQIHYSRSPFNPLSSLLLFFIKTAHFGVLFSTICSLGPAFYSFGGNFY